MNKVILRGNLVRDPDVRYTQGQNSTAVARYTLAVTRRMPNKDGEHEADFISCVATDVVIEEQEFAESRAASERGRETATAPAPAPGDGFMDIPEGFEREGLPFS